MSQILKYYFMVSKIQNSPKSGITTDKPFAIFKIALPSFSVFLLFDPISH